MSAARFSSVILDVDSTLTGIEGIDWLARRCGPAVADDVARLTDRAMDGEVSLDAVYGLRLQLVKPSVVDCRALSDAYVAAVAPGAAETIRALHAAGVSIALVSGGIRQSILPLADMLRIPHDLVHAVSLVFQADGKYRAFNESSPLSTQQGKALVASRLALAPPVLAIGDGATDAAMKPAVDTFAAYVGFVERPLVVQEADMVFRSFEDILHTVLT